MHDLGAGGFYFPRRLGRPRPRSEQRPGLGQVRGEAYETWREGLERHDLVFELVSERFIRGNLLQDRRSSAPGFTMITGEPGSGKSWLLEELVNVWASADPAPHLGARMPILVRLRDVNSEDLAPCDPDALADRLWQRQAATPASLASPSASFFSGQQSGRAWHPLWLLDGLDELPGEHQTDDLFGRLAVLPGRTCVTCRTAIAQANARELRRWVVSGGHLELLPLSEEEQRDFLTACFGGDEERAAALHRRVRANPQLRELAGSPLLLGLIAEVGEMTLPGGRAAFYREAVAELWRRRVKSGNQERLRPYRDQALTALAAGMTLERIVAPIDFLDQALVTADIESSARPSLGETLKTSGLLRIAREKVEFLHLTLQEFYLARHLANGAFADALEDLWGKPRYEETLALLIATVDQDRASEVDRVLLAFVDDNLQRHRHEPAVLWQKGRSPLRLVFHLLARAGVKFGTLSLTWTRLLVLMAEDSPLLRLALAADRRSPAELLARLAGDGDDVVRRFVARNVAAPPEALARLAGDDDADVRHAVAVNAAALAEVLARLAGDGDVDVRSEVAQNVASPAEVLARLAGDDDAFVRSEVARNGASPAEVLARLAADATARVRRAVAVNAVAPAQALAYLAAAGDEVVRRAVAGNEAVPAEVLVRLAGDDDAFVRGGVARNAAAPAEIRARLAGRGDARLRGGVAQNAAAPAEVLARLAGDDDAFVRRSVARNEAAPAEVLACLAGDDHLEVRHAVAANTATPAEALARLADDPDEMVRSLVARNAAAPVEALARLAGDGEARVREGVARYAAAAAEALARLAGDDDEVVRRAVAMNEAAPVEAWPAWPAAMTTPRCAARWRRTRRRRRRCWPAWQAMATRACAAGWR